MEARLQIVSNYVALCVETVAVSIVAYGAAEAFLQVRDMNKTSPLLCASASL